MPITISALANYPIKGLSGQLLDKVVLNTGQGFPNDRQFGFARPDSGFDPNNPKPLPKTKFYMLARDASLALLNTKFDAESGQLTLSASDQLLQVDITTDKGKKEAGLFLQSFLSLSEEETPQLFEAYPHRFTDVSVDSVAMMNAVSIINLDSVNEFSNVIGQEVDPRRFRGNIHLSNMQPFKELDMVGQQLVIGSVRLQIVQRTKRCPATEVDLKTGKRDIKTPKLLREKYGHMDMGIYAQVLEGGVIANGDTVDIGS